MCNRCCSETDAPRYDVYAIRNSGTYARYPTLTSVFPSRRKDANFEERSRCFSSYLLTSLACPSVFYGRASTCGVVGPREMEMERTRRPFFERADDINFPTRRSARWTREGEVVEVVKTKERSSRAAGQNASPNAWLALGSVFIPRRVRNGPPLRTDRPNEGK